MTREEFLKWAGADRYDNVKFVPPMYGDDRDDRMPEDSVVHIAFRTNKDTVDMVCHINGRIHKSTVENTGNTADDYDKAIEHTFRHFYSRDGYTELS